MKNIYILLVAIMIAFTGISSALAAGTVQVDQAIAVSADVSNITDTDIDAAVKLFAYDNVGNIAGHVCKEVTLDAKSTTAVSFQWRAPSYQTGIYWSSKVEIDGSCVNHDADDTDEIDDDDDDDDDDGDGNEE